MLGWDGIGSIAHIMDGLLLLYGIIEMKSCRSIPATKRPDLPTHICEMKIRWPREY